MAAGDQTLEHLIAQLAGEGAGIPRLIGTTPGGDLHAFPHHTLEEERDNTANENEKTVTVPAGETWWIHTIFVRYTATATVGNRIILVTANAATIAMWETWAPAAITASQDVRITMLPGVELRTNPLTATWMQIPIPPRLIIPPTGSLRVTDDNDTDGLDDMVLDIYHSTYTL